MPATLLSERADTSVVLTLNRPQCRNALSAELVNALRQALAAAAGDDQVRSIIITGAPPAFCAGLDLRELAALTSAQAERAAAALEQLYQTIDTHPKPVIAAVNGAAVAGGAGLVTACDLAIASEAAVVGYPEVKQGLVAAIVMTWLLRLVGQRAAKQLLFTGEVMGAAQGQAIGLFNEVVPADQLLIRARQWASLFATCPASVLADTKRVFNQVRNHLAAGRMDEVGALNVAVPLSADARTGLDRFLKGRSELQP
jgi:methylglutaconyl-CoA hydratase